MCNPIKPVIQYSVFSVVAAGLLFLISMVINVGVQHVDELLVPCQHGTQYSQGKCRCDDSPFNGTYCSECLCVNGFCSTEPTIHFKSSDYGCRCPTQTKWFGYLCDLCNAQNQNGRCKGSCINDYYGERCNKKCFPDMSYDNVNRECEDLIRQGGTCNVCNGHGTCEEGECVCDKDYFNEGPRKCFQTCPTVLNKTCSGHGLCELFGDRAGCKCENGWNGIACDIPCPGVETTGIPCNNNGKCIVDYNERVATCDCRQKFRKEDCSIECPGDYIPCNGHGTCDNNGVCTCESIYTGLSCKCSDVDTCNENGRCIEDNCACFGNFDGENCDRCKENWHGDDCDLFCDPYLEASGSFLEAGGFGCYGHGICIATGKEVHCECNLNTFGRLNVGGAVRNLQSLYDPEINCRDCKTDYFPRYSVFNRENRVFAVPCQEKWVPVRCDYRGVLNTEYNGDEGVNLCICDHPNLDPATDCKKCKENWFPSESCDNFCIPEGMLDDTCDGTINCTQCNGHGTCTSQGVCDCEQGYSGDQCQVHCASINDQECSGHGKCVSTPMQQLLEYEFRRQSGITSYSCQCDPQSIGTTPEYFGSKCEHNCVKPPWENSVECNGMGNCTIFMIQSPLGQTYDCVTDQDCKTNSEISSILSGEINWSEEKGPFCHSLIETQPLGCSRTKEDCYDIIRHQRPESMRSQVCVDACLETIEAIDWHEYCNEIKIHRQPEVFKDCKSVQSFCPAKNIPSYCNTMVDLTDGVNVSQKLNYHYEYDKRQYPFKMTMEYRISTHAVLHDEAEAEFLNTIVSDYKLPIDFCSKHGVRFPTISYVRENKQYICNGAIQNNSNCSGVLADSENNLYKPFIVVCPNSKKEYETYVEAISNREMGCIVEELDKEYVNSTDDGIQHILDTCNAIKSIFPTCEYPKPCDFNPCASGYKCLNDGLLADCEHVEGPRSNKCNKGTNVSQTRYSVSYKCAIDVPDTSCPRDITFKTNVFQHCIDNNPIVSPGEAEFIRFEFRAPDIQNYSIIEFGDISVYVSQGQIQLNETSDLQSCPVDNPTCTDIWRYQANLWYTVELERNGTHVIMRRGDAEIVKEYIGNFDSYNIPYASASFRNIWYEKNIPSPYSCEYETCDLDVSYRKICSDIIHNIDYPSLIEPKHNILEVCSTIFDSEQINLDLNYEETEKVQNLDWDIYCSFYNAFETSNVSSTYTELEDYTNCQEFIDPLDGNKSCIEMGLSYNWTESCKELRDATLPSSIVSSCPETCYKHLFTDTTCNRRSEFFDSNTHVIENCSMDWYDSCLKEAKGQYPGKCSAVECDCQSEKNLGITGESCELFCHVGSDGSPCSEDSGLGKCSYTKQQQSRLNISSKPYKNVWALHGQCNCLRQEGDRSCDIECRGCNEESYDGGQIGICDNRLGICKCLPPFTNINYITRTNWRNESIEMNEREYNDGNLTGHELYRVRMMQGRESFIKNALEYSLIEENIELQVISSPPEWQGDLTLCKNKVYDFLVPDGYNMVLVEEEACTFLGCEQGRYISMPASIATINGTYVFNTTGTYYYLSEGYDTMVNKITVESCSGKKVYDGTVNWETIYNDFITFPNQYWCNDRQCDQYDIVMLGNMEDGSSRYNYDCNLECPGFNETTQLSCSGRGRCGVTGNCICDPALISSAVLNIKQVNGEETISIESDSNLELTGYRGESCEIVCPGFNEETGDMRSICNGHGTCDLAGKCACEIGYIGDMCQFTCPVVDGSICTGHGTCEMTEISVSLDTYEGFSDNCQHFSGVGHCKNYAILENLTYVDVASTQIVGENKHCTVITKEQCKYWAEYQNINYNYLGELNTVSLPSGCIFTSNKQTYYNNFDGVECGTLDTLCVCKADTPDETFCSVKDNHLILHTKGGNDFIEMKGLYTFEKSTHYNTLSDAKANCNNCLAIQKDPPVGNTYYIVQSSNNLRQTYNKPYTSLSTQCMFPSPIGDPIPVNVDLDDAILTCMTYCETDPECSSFSIDVSNPEQKVCNSCDLYTYRSNYLCNDNDVRIFMGEFAGSNDNPCTGDAEDCTERCANGCRDRLTPVMGSWDTVDQNGGLKGFTIDPFDGTCFCNYLDWDTCDRSSMAHDWKRYDMKTHDTEYSKQIYFQMIPYRTDLISVNQSVCNLISTSLNEPFTVQSEEDMPSGCIYTGVSLIFNTLTTNMDPSLKLKLVVNTENLSGELLYKQTYGRSVSEVSLSGNFVQYLDTNWKIDRSYDHVAITEAWITSCNDYCRLSNNRFSNTISNHLSSTGFYVQTKNAKVLRYYNFIQDYERYDLGTERTCQQICPTYYHCSRALYTTDYGASRYEFRCSTLFRTFGDSDYVSPASKFITSNTNVYSMLEIGPYCFCSNIEQFVDSGDETSLGVYDQRGVNEQFIGTELCNQYAENADMDFASRNDEENPYGCYVSNDIVYFNECGGNDLNCPTASVEKQILLLEKIKAFVNFDGDNGASLTQSYCEGYAISYKRPFFLTHDNSIPKGCSMISSMVIYNTDATSNIPCGMYWCVQYFTSSTLTYKYAVETYHFVQNELKSGEKYTVYIKSPPSLCITEEALAVDSNIQSPIITALKRTNHECNVEVVSDTCENKLSLNECIDESHAIVVTKYNKPDGCFTESDILYFNVYSDQYYRTVHGNPTNSSQTVCEQYSGTLGYWDSGKNKNNYPSGCIDINGVVFYNEVQTDRPCFYNNAICIHHCDNILCGTYTELTNNGDFSMTLEECIEYAQLTNESFSMQTDSTSIPSGCIIKTDGLYYNVNQNNISCTATDICVKRMNRNCSFENKCLCKTNRYKDKTSDMCLEIENEPIIEVTIVQDRNTEDEIRYSTDCQILTNSSVQCTQCNCFRDINYGHWDGTTCSTCSIGYGKSQCNTICPEFDGENKDSMCSGFGQCLFGSEQTSVERIFQQANCVCGQENEFQAKIQNRLPNARYSDEIEDYSYFEPVTDGKQYNDLNFAKVQCDRYNDISLANLNGFCYGVFKRENLASSKYEIHLGDTGTEYIQYALYYRKELIPEQTVSYDLKNMDLQTKIDDSNPETCRDDISIAFDGFDFCNHFKVDSNTCNECEETWTGKNCRNKCQKCLARGICDTTPDENSMSKCSCPTDELWEYQCCPAGFLVTDLIKWQSMPQRRINQIKIQSVYDQYTNNMLDASYFCKKCPGLLDSEWLNPNAIFKVCSGETRGECVVNKDTLNPVCECQLNELSGVTWKGRACSCDDSLDEPYNLDPEFAEVTDYGCLIPTNGQAVCPESNPTQSKALFYYPFMLYAIGKSIDQNFPEGDKYLGQKSRLSSPIKWSGGVAFNIAITDGPHGKCDDETPCHTGEGPCATDSDCAGGLKCNMRGSNSIIQGYDTTKKNLFYRYCYDPNINMIGCDPIPTFTNFDGSTNFYNYRYWNGTSFALASPNHYVPMSKDANNNLIIHKREFPCPKGKYGVVWENLKECALCPQGQYQDQTGQSSCKSPCLGTLVGVTDFSDCEQCDPGYTPKQDVTGCEACPNGKYEQNSKCYNCPLHTYQLEGVDAQAGVGSCIECPSGTYTDGEGFIDYTGHGTCLSCQPGTFGNREQGCKTCVAGKYSDNELLSIGLFGYTDDISKEECIAFANSENKEFRETNDYALSEGCSNFLLQNIVYWNNLDNNQECLYCIKKQNYYLADKPTDYVLGRYVTKLSEKDCELLDRNKWGGVTNSGPNSGPPGCHYNLLSGTIHYNPDISKECSDTFPGATCIQRVRSGPWVADGQGFKLVEYRPYNDDFNSLYNKLPSETYNTQTDCLTACEIECARFQHLSCHQESSKYKCMCSNNKYSNASDSTGIIKSRWPEPITKCENCKRGKFNEIQGSSYCDFCESGKYKDNDSSRECKECSSGRYENEKGSIVCKDCPKGRYADKNGYSECKCCETAKYQDQTGQTSCKTGFKGRFEVPGYNDGNYCMEPRYRVGNTCADSLFAPLPKFFKELSGKKPSNFFYSDGSIYKGRKNNAFECFLACLAEDNSKYLGFSYQWLGVPSGNSKRCWCDYMGGKKAIVDEQYHSFGTGFNNIALGDMYSIVTCPKEHPEARDYYDTDCYAGYENLEYCP